MKENPKARAKAQESQEAQEKVCPRCGGKFSYIEAQRKGGQTYYVAVHYEGYEKVGGRVRKR